MSPPVAARRAACPAPLRVLVIDDHRVFTDLLALALDADPALACVGIASGFAEGRVKAEVIDADVVLVDVQLGDGDGTELVAALTTERSERRVIVLTAHPNALDADRALRAGASGYLAKSGRLRDLFGAIHDARPSRPAVAATPPPGPLLSERERDVLLLLAAGLRASDIAERRRLSPHTVRDHIKAVRLALGARSQVEALARARELGMLNGVGVGVGVGR